MGTKAFFSETTKERIGATVEAIESKTRAEVVVAVQPRLTGLEAWPLGAAAALAYLGLLGYLYLPIDFSLWVAAGGVPLLFVGTLASTRALDILRRALVPDARERERAVEMARATFQRLGVHETRERNGILVHVTPHDRSIVVLPDRGLREVVSEAKIAALEGCLLGDVDVDTFEAALRTFGDHLAELQPRGDKTDDELENVA